MTKAFETSFPMKKTKIGYDNRHPWITFGLKTSIQKKHYLHTKSLRYPTLTNINLYKQYKNKLTRILRNTERHYYMEQFGKCQNNMKKSWELIKTVINKRKIVKQKNIKLLINGKLTEDKKMIANAFNDFFTEIGENLDKKIPASATDPVSFIKKSFTINIFLAPTNPEEIAKIITNLRNCAVGWDNFPADILKDNKELMSDLLSHMINLSINKGVFPTELKV
jgi:hypothetical protein